MKIICLLQKRMVKLVENAKPVSHSYPFFLKYRILKLNDMTDFNQATFMYKYMNNLLPLSRYPKPLRQIYLGLIAREGINCIRSSQETMKTDIKYQCLC